MSNIKVLRKQELPKLDKNKINEKKELLDHVAKQLKSEFFGLDEIIDKIIDSVRAWYIFPEIINRPVIVNLWGLTGVGKTGVVRRLTSLLNFNEKFVEVQMDGGSVTSTYNANSLTNILSGSQIEEGQPGILLLDEIQRFRTIDEHGTDIKLERFQDVWTLLSDGKFSADASMFSEIEMMIAYQNWNKDSKEDDEDEDTDPAAGEKKKKPKERMYQIYPWEAKNLKKVLRLQESITEIMAWDTQKISHVLANMKMQKTTWEIDYTKLLIFVSGNLDTAFIGSTNADDCDTDADFYHEMTKKISTTEIKDNLGRRFRPEQISRLGNNHIIYPSMSKKSYELLIDSCCQKYITEMEEVSGIHFTLDNNIKTEIYNNSVYPTQGTRPVFSSIHMIFSSVLVNVTFWCIENSIKDVNLFMSPDLKFIVAETGKQKKEFEVYLELNDKKAKTSINQKTLVAVHESGHAYVYSKLYGIAPVEVKINTASFSGGYMLPVAPKGIKTKTQIRNEICTLLAGTAAEEIMFGDKDRSNGATSDLFKATDLASQYVRKYGFHNSFAWIDSESTATNWNTNLNETNTDVNKVLDEEYNHAKDIINSGHDSIKILVNKLLEVSTIKQDEYKELMKDYVELTDEGNLPQYNKIWLEKNEEV